MGMEPEPDIFASLRLLFVEKKDGLAGPPHTQAPDLFSRAAAFSGAE